MAGCLAFKAEPVDRGDELLELGPRGCARRAAPGRRPPRRRAAARAARRARASSSLGHRVVGRADLELQRGAEAATRGRAARCPTAARRRRSAAACRCSCARFQRWNSSVSSSRCGVVDRLAACPLSANQRASSDLPERGGPVSTAVRNGQVARRCARRLSSRRCALAVADRRCATGRVAIAAQLERVEERSGVIRPLPLARDAERAAALRCHLPAARLRSAAARPSMSPTKVTRSTEVPPIATLLTADAAHARARRAPRRARCRRGARRAWRPAR